MWGGGLQPAATAQAEGFQGVDQAAEVPGEVPGSVVGSEASGPLVGVVDVAIVLVAAVALWWLWRRDVIRPRSFARRGVRRLDGAAWWLLGLGLVMTFLGQGLGAALGEAIVRGREDAELSRQAMMAAVGGLMGIVAGVVVLAGYIEEGSGRVEGLELRVRWRGVVKGILALLVALPIVHVASAAAVVVVTMWRGEQPDLLAHDTLKAMVENLDSPWTWVMGFSAVVLAPIAEEMIFRVFLQSMLLKLFRNTCAAVLVTSVIFAAAHLGAGVGAESAHALPALCVLGVAMGVAYERSRSLVVPVIMHMGFNFLNVGLAIAAN